LLFTSDSNQAMNFKVRDILKDNPNLAGGNPNLAMQNQWVSIRSPVDMFAGGIPCAESNIANFNVSDCRNRLSLID